MKYLNKLSTQIGISLFIMVVLSFFWWQTKFSTKNITINLNDNKSKTSLNIEEAKYSGFFRAPHSADKLSKALASLLR